MSFETFCVGFVLFVLIFLLTGLFGLVSAYLISDHPTSSDIFHFVSLFGWVASTVWVAICLTILLEKNII